MADFPERKKLIQYLTPFVQSFGEMQEIMRVEEDWMDKMESHIGKLYDNAFIEDCDEYGIRKYEKLLGILPDTEENLEIRKLRVRAGWNDAIPYTYRTMVKKMNLYCGVNNYDIDADLENYKISFSIYGRADIEEMNLFLDMLLPQNIVYDIKSTAGFAGEGRTGIVWQDDEIFTLRQVII